MSQLYPGPLRGLADFSHHDHIELKPHEDSIKFKLQRGPIKEAGLNGCQVDDLIKAAKHILNSFNLEFPCDHNEIALNSLNDALKALEDRKKTEKKEM